MHTCELCLRSVQRITRHHLIPRMYHKKPRNKGFSREFLNNHVAHLCSLCHRQVHRTFTHRALEMQYNTIDDLASAPELQRFLGWARKQR